MSSHREAPEISKDPVADNTDLYAFVSPDRPDTVTLITNYIPLEDPGRRPELLRVRRRRAATDQHRQRRRRHGRRHLRVPVQHRGRATRTRSCTTPGRSPADRPELGTASSSTRCTRARTATAGSDECSAGPAVPAVQHRPALDPELRRPRRRRRCTTSAAARRCSPGSGSTASTSTSGRSSTCGDLRPFQNLHLIPTPGGRRASTRCARSTCTASRIQVPITQLTRDGSDADRPDVAERACIGVWTRRQRAAQGSRCATSDTGSQSGPFVQVSRLGQPAVQRGHRPDGRQGPAGTGCRPTATTSSPSTSPASRAGQAAAGALSRACSRTWRRSRRPVPTCVAILLTGIPAGIVPGFQNFTGPTQADLLRLNVAIPPAAKPNIFGILGGDLAGFPNGRRVGRRHRDDRAAGDRRAHVSRWSTRASPLTRPRRCSPTGRRTGFLSTFPYLDTPHSGFDVAGSMSAPGWHRVGRGDRHTAYGGPVMLDVGGDMGALVLLTTPDWAGRRDRDQPPGRRRVSDPRRGAPAHGGQPHGPRRGLLEPPRRATTSSGPRAERPGPVVHVPGGSVVQERWVEPRALHDAGTP